MLDPSELIWNDVPSLPGVKISVIEGPLNQAVIMFRLKFPPNFKVTPHWHPGIEDVTMISGTLHMGGAHSLRSGFLTSAAAKGASIFKMMDVSRHRSVDTLRGYVRDAEIFKDHAGAGLL